MVTSEKSTHLPRRIIAMSAVLTRVKAGHLTPITRPRAVVRVILSAVEATT